MLRIQLLTRDDWHELREVRLSALSDSPRAFLSSYDRELAYGEKEWRTEFSRGHWNIGICQGTTVGLLGATREPGMPANERYLEYLWVSPECRRSKVASRLLRAVLKSLCDAGVRIAWLWILDGNDPALQLYKRFGFFSTSERQPLPADPERSEERMRLNLR
jgi:ribosomal protein S18 acetylase RimI-like enzyme